MTNKLRIFFDGACPLCRKEMGLYQRADHRGVIEWIDVSQEIPACDLPAPRQLLLARFHVQQPSGQLLSGARGFVELWRRLPGWRWLGLACSFPGIPSLMEIGYAGFLRIRPLLQRAARHK